MLRLSMATLLCCSIMLAAFTGARAANSKLITDTGNLLRGKVYKQSGIPREGVITIRTKWNLPAIAPVFRYDFDIINGKVEQNLYSFLVGDIAEMAFLPAGDGEQYINIKLRNGVIHRIQLTSEKKAVLGPVSLWITEVSVITDGYGENIIPVGEVNRIEFSAPADDTRDMDELVSEFSRALEIGVRDDLIDDDLAVVMDKIQKRMKARMLHEKKGQD